MAFELEFGTAGQARAIGVADDDVVLGLEFLDAQLGIGVAVIAGFLIGVIGGEIVDLERGVGMLSFLCAAAEQAGFGPFEIEVVDFVGAGLDLLHPGTSKGWCLWHRRLLRSWRDNLNAFRSPGYSEWALMASASLSLCLMAPPSSTCSKK